MSATGPFNFDKATSSLFSTETFGFNYFLLFTANQSNCCAFLCSLNKKTIEPKIILGTDFSLFMQISQNC